MMKGISRTVVLLVLLVGIWGGAAANAITLTGSNVKNNSLQIPTEGISSQAKFFPFTVDGMAMEVFVVKASDGTYRTAFNTCQVCYNSGRGQYTQQGDVMVCGNCGNRFKVDQIEKQKNGCNPIPISLPYKTEKNGVITIGNEILEAAKPVFAKWKR